MENKFEQAFKSTLNDECVLTENAANAFATSGSALVDLNFAVSSLRGASVEDIQSKFQAAFFEDPLHAVKWLFFARDIRGNGMGERRLFRICFSWLANARPKLVKKLIPLVAEYGRFDDILRCGLEGELWNAVVDYIAEQFKKDIDNSFEGKSISLLAKWLPSCNASSTKTRALATKIRHALGLDEKSYRQNLSALRKHLDVLEVKASSNRWEKIDYNTVPSMANLKYKNAFLKHDEARRRQYLSALEKPDSGAKINASTSFPCDIVTKYDVCNGARRSSINSIDSTLEAMWKALPNYIDGNDDGSTIVVCDTSGSMTARVDGTACRAIDVAHSLAIYFSERLTGPFKDKFITFSESPKYVDMHNCTSLKDKLNVAYAAAEYSNTDLRKTFMLILKTAVDNGLSQNDLPSNVLVVSDMNFDQGTYIYHRYSAASCSLMKEIADKFAESGYKLPRLVYWSVIGGTGRNAPLPVQVNSAGATLVSGFSPAIAKMVFSGKTNPYDVVIEAIDAPRYKPIEDAFNDAQA